MSTPDLVGVRLITADDVCRAVQDVLTGHLSRWAQASGLPDVKTWQQLPTAQAISAADVPAGAITSPGLTEPPTKHRTSYDATWRVSVAVYDRGSDHSDTQRRTRIWAALIRTVLTQHPTLGGIARRLDWVGEEYALGPEQGARTLGGCAVAFDVTVVDVVPPVAPPELGGAPTAPTVITTRPAITVRPISEE